MKKLLEQPKRKQNWGYRSTLIDRAGYPVHISKTRSGWEYPDFDRIGMHLLDPEPDKSGPETWRSVPTDYNAAHDPTVKKEPGPAPKHRLTRLRDNDVLRSVDDEGRSEELRPLNPEELKVQASKTAVGLVPLLENEPDLKPELRPLTADEAEVLRLKSLGWTHTKIADQMNISLRKVDALVRTLKNLNIASQESSQVIDFADLKTSQTEPKPIVSKEIA